MKNENELEKLLTEWFDNSDLLKKHFWTRNKVGRLIKDRLNEIKKWRYRMRGDAKKGYAEMDKKMKERKQKEYQKKLESW